MKGRAKAETPTSKKSLVPKDPKFPTTMSTNQPTTKEGPDRLAGNNIALEGTANAAHPVTGIELAEMIAGEIGVHLPQSGV